MIEFPETVQQEWEDAAAAVGKAAEVKARIDRGVAVEHELDRLRVRHSANEQLLAEIEAEATPTLEMGTLADYLANPLAAPVDMVDGAMKENGLCVVIGPSQSGKTTIALQLVHSLMTGADWLGQRVTQISGGAGIMSYDMDAAGIFDWVAGAPNLNPDKISVVNAYRHGNPLAVPEHRAKIVTVWKSMLVDIVVVDSFSASFFGKDQNDAAATMSHYRDLKRFALTEVGAKALIVIAHSTDASPGKVRGSTVHKDTADTVISVAVDDKTQSRTVNIEKYRAARGKMKMAPVVVTAPDDVTHLVSLDTGAMALAGLQIPASVGADLFPDLPQAHEEPDTDSDEDEEVDL